MFALLNGGWPRVTGDGLDVDELERQVAGRRQPRSALADALDVLVAEVVAAQVEAGFDLVTDGQVRWPALDDGLGPAGSGSATGDAFVTAWRATAALTGVAVAQAVPGPYSVDRRRHPGESAGARTARTLVLADTLAAVLEALADAGCPVAIVEEPQAIAVGDDARERALFAEAQHRLLARTPGLHVTLAISGGSAAAAGPEVILGAPYQSWLFDLIDGPDNWHLVRAVPDDRGIICGALRVGEAAVTDQSSLLIWAARYAASGRRGIDRVGLTNASSLRSFSPRAARRVLVELGTAARLAVMAPEAAVAEGLDPRTFGRTRLPSGPGPDRTGSSG